jgi:hypothetical protein
MSELRTLKNSGIVRIVTFLTPIRKNVTRWSSTYNILKRYVELEPFFPQCMVFSKKVLNLIPSAIESQAIKEVCTQLKKFDSVCKILQCEDGIGLRDVRALFRALQDSFPSDPMPHLSPSLDATESHFENGVIKILSGDEGALNKEEKNALKNFKIRKQDAVDEAEAVTVDEDDDFAGCILNSREKARIEEPSAYRSVKHVSPTSNIVERLFSRAKLIMSDRRKYGSR